MFQKFQFRFKNSTLILNGVVAFQNSNDNINGDILMFIFAYSTRVNQTVHFLTIYKTCKIDVMNSKVLPPGRHFLRIIHIIIMQKKNSGNNFFLLSSQHKTRTIYEHYGNAQCSEK